MCFHGTLDVTKVSSSSQTTFVGFEAEDQPGDPNSRVCSLVCIRATFCGEDRENSQTVAGLQATSCLLQPAGLKTKLFDGLASR